jgi:predicted GIY-YIG superfamily endonuclease
VEPSSAPPRVWSVYLLRCADGTLYAGSTTDVAARAAAHNAGRGARYTSGRRPVAVVYVEACGSRSAALRREHALKRLTRSEKEALVASTRP